MGAKEDEGSASIREKMHTGRSHYPEFFPNSVLKAMEVQMEKQKLFQIMDSIEVLF